MMRSLTDIVLAAVLAMVALGLVAGTGPTLADESSDATPVTATFQQAVARGDGGISVSVRLASADGEPVARQPVEFFVTPDFLGERPVFIRAAVTNKDGVSSIIYEPTWEGEHRITAHYAGDDTHEPIEATSVLQLSGLPLTDLPVEDHLSPLRRWATPGAIAVVLVVWLILATVVFRVGWGIWAIGSRYETAEDATPRGVYSPHVSSGAGTRTWHGPGPLSTGANPEQSDMQRDTDAPANQAP